MGREKQNPARLRIARYPDYTAERLAIDEAGGAITSEILARAIIKHRENALYNRGLCERYQAIDEGVPIFHRVPRFPTAGQINNQINADFFSEIVDFKVGYFAGKPIAYAYSDTEEAINESGGKDQRDAIQKALTDFTTRANLFDVDMQCVKYAAICGYGARLFYIDRNGCENVLAVPPYQAILMSEVGEIADPKYGIRYYKYEGIDGKMVYCAEFYNDTDAYFFTGDTYSDLTLREAKPHMFTRCPLQGVPNNEEMSGDAESVLSLIDAYDRLMSDCSNEIDGAAQSYLVLKNVPVDAKKVEQMQMSGVLDYYSGSSDTGDIYYLTKNVNDTFIQNFADRLEKNIFHRSKTPDLTDQTFGTASGIALKFKLTELETKCGMLQAKMQAAGMYMFGLLSESWAKRLHLRAVPEQFVMEFTRNFPLDALSEAQAAVEMINSGLPAKVAYANAYSFIDDVEYVMQLKDEEGAIAPSFQE